MKPNDKSYAWWFDVASNVRKMQQAKGKSFADGVERAAALSAVARKTIDEGVDAVEIEFMARRISRQRDGSIA